MATKINLLPWRAELRERRKKDFLTVLAGCALVGLLIFAVWYLAVQALIDYQNMRNSKLQSEISLLDKKVDEINALKKQRTEMGLPNHFENRRNTPTAKTCRIPPLPGKLYRKTERTALQH